MEKINKLKNIKLKEYKVPYFSRGSKKYKSSYPFIIENNYHIFVWKVENGFIIELYIPELSLNLINLYNKYNNTGKIDQNIIDNIYKEVETIFTIFKNKAFNQDTKKNNINSRINILISKIRAEPTDELITQLKEQINLLITTINNDTNSINYDQLFNKNINREIYNDTKKILPLPFLNHISEFNNKWFNSSVITKLEKGKININTDVVIELSDKNIKDIKNFFKKRLIKKKLIDNYQSNIPYKIQRKNAVDKINHKLIIDSIFSGKIKKANINYGYNNKYQTELKTDTVESLGKKENEDVHSKKLGGKDDNSRKDIKRYLKNIGDNKNMSKNEYINNFQSLDNVLEL